MKLVAVSRVRIEADIIEAFIRHHCEHFHKLIVLDDGSSDETLQILRSLQAAGYDGAFTLEVFTPDRRHLDYSRQVLRRIWDESARRPVPQMAAAQAQ